MNSITTGSTVTCANCGKKTTVSFITDRQGTPAYDLACFHRNAFCETCQKLVPDISESIQEVRSACPTCNPELIEPDDDDDED